MFHFCDTHLEFSLISMIKYHLELTPESYKFETRASAENGLRVRLCITEVLSLTDLKLRFVAKQ